jgi:flagellar protein FliO/FliZ
VSALGGPASPLSVGSLTELTLSLAAIVGFILGVSWLLRRLKVAGPRGRGEIAVLDELAVGPRERIVLLRVGSSQVLVGVGAGGVVGLTPLADPVEIKLAAGTPPFAERLRELMKRPGGAP